MKTFDFFDLDVRKENQSKFRKIKLLISSLLLIMSFTIIGYRTISLANINKEKVSNTAYTNIENKSFQKNLRGNIYDRNNKILATTISTLSLNINPQEILNKYQTITKLTKIFPNSNFEISYFFSSWFILVLLIPISIRLFKHSWTSIGFNIFSVINKLLM